MSGNQNPPHERHQGDRFVLPAGRHIEAQGDVPVGDQQMHLDAETALRVAQGMFSRLLPLRRFGSSSEEGNRGGIFSPRRRPGKPG
jgi:hypothetical protein